MKNKTKLILSILFVVLFFSISYISPAQDNIDNGISLSDVIHLALQHNPDIKIQEKVVESREGAMQSAKGEFDIALGANASWQQERTEATKAQKDYPGINESKNDIYSANANLHKKFQTGINVELQSSLSRTETETSYNDNATPLTKTESTPLNKSRVDLIVTIPLLKGRGEKSAGANLVAAKIDYESGTLELRHRVAQSILTTAHAYFDYLAAYLILKERIIAEEKAKLVSSNTKKLIEAGKRPVSEEKQLDANLSSAKVNKLSAEQSFLAAKQRLGIAAGIPYKEILKLPAPVGDFSKAEKNVILNLYESNEKLIKQSLEKRPDLIAAKKGVNSGEILVAAAKRDLQPRVDLKTSVGYAGFEEEDSKYSVPSYVNSYKDNVAGYNASISLSLEWPFANNYYSGIYKQRKALYDQKILSLNDLERNIQTNIFIALDNLKNSMLQLEESHVAVASYQGAEADEENKIRLGASDIFNLLSIQDRLVSIKITEIISKQQFSKALASLRFELSDLTPESGDNILNTDILITAPQNF